MKWLVCAAALLLLPDAAVASVMLERPLESLAVQADLVARGTVTSMESHLSADGRKIVTVVTVEIHEAWKGAPPRTVRIQIHGGTVGDVVQMVSGEATFVLGEDVVVFLGGISVPSLPASVLKGPVYRVLGMAQGKLSVRTDPSLGEVAAPDLRDLSFAEGPGKTVSSAVSPAPVPLAQLRARVQRALAP